MKYKLSNLPQGVKYRFRHYHSGNTPEEVLASFGVKRVVTCDLTSHNGKPLSHVAVPIQKNVRKRVARIMALGKAFKLAHINNKLEI